MNFEIAVNGRSRTVAIEGAAAAGRFNAVVAGRAHAVDVSWSDPDTLSVIEDGVVREVRVHQREDGVLDIAIGGRSFVAHVVRRAGLDVRRAGLALQDPPHFTRLAVQDPPRSSRHDIKAPMPGRVVRVLVAPGAAVAARQPVVIVEAMKMENELRSSGTGIVKEIRVQEGDAIDTGATLLVIEYAPSV